MNSINSTIEMEGYCKVGEKVSEAYNDLKSELETVGLISGKDFNIVSQDGRFVDFHEGEEVYFMFEVKILSQKFIDVCSKQGWL